MDALQTGKLIKEARTEKGLTQQALADEVHVSAAAVSKWENGHSFPDISVLESLSSALGVSISEIVMGKRMESENSTNDENEAMRSVLNEAVRQRRKGIVKWVLVTLAAVLVIAAGSTWLFLIGPKAKQSEIEAWTEIQENNDVTEWVIHFDTVDGRSLYPYTEETSVLGDDGETSYQGRIIHLRIPLLGQAHPGSFTWGYSLEPGLSAGEDYDFFVIVDYADGQVKYSLKEEGYFKSRE